MTAAAVTVRHPGCARFCADRSETLNQRDQDGAEVIIVDADLWQEMIARAEAMSLPGPRWRPMRGGGR